MRVLVWAFRAFVFFALFAFALNNQQDATVHWFFGAQWRAPMVIVVLAAFAAGGVVGVLAMLPGWWRRRSASAATLSERQPPGPARNAATTSGDAAPLHPPREGL